MGAHALLSPSAAHRWMNCTAAPRLEINVEDAGSDYAAEGTLAHAYCALKLKKYLGLPTADEEKEIEALSQYHTGEMDEYTDTYVSIVLEKFNAARAHTKDAQLLVETRLDFSKHIPDAFGTADAIIIADCTIDEIDFKYGKGVKVSAFQNPQVMIYGLGAFEKFDFEYDIRRVRMTIIQPRIDNLSEYEVTTAELLSWAIKELEPKAKEAYSGNGKQQPGDWCQFCKVKHTCRALVNLCKETAQNNAQLLSTDELAKDVLPMLPIIKTWLAGVEDYALQQALSGVSLPGWKLVEGRSNRKIVNVEGAATALINAGYAKTAIYKPQELCTITELEKLVGKKQFAALCADFIEKPKGKPTLAEESDKRPALDPVAEDFKDVQL